MSGTKTFCNVCNLMLNSYDQYVVHLTGKSHKRREQARASGQGTESAPVTKIVRAKPFIHFVSGQDGNGSASSQNLTQNTDGSSVDNQANDSVQNGANESVPPKNEEIFCNICMVKLTSQSQADMHYAGSKHKRAIAMAGRPGDARGEGIKRKYEEVCEVCNVPLITKAVAEAHYGGSKHEKKLKLSQTIGATNPSQTAPYSSGVSFPHQQKTTQPGSMFFCSFCHISVNSQMQMDAHREGMKHQCAVNGIAQQRKKVFTPRQPQTQEPGRFIRPSHDFQTGNFGNPNPNGPVPFRAGPPMAYPTPYF